MNRNVFLKAVGELQSGDKKDGSGKWYARDIVVEANDNTLYRDTFVVRYTGEKAIEPAIQVGKLYQAEIVFATRTNGERVYQDLWLKSLTPVESANKDSNEPF